MKSEIALRDMARPDREPLIHLENSALMPLPAPLDDPGAERAWKTLSEQARRRYECGLDDTCALSLPQPNTPAEEKQLVARFLTGLEKLFTRQNNWTFLQPLLLTMEHRAKCQTCGEACHIFQAGGRNEV